MKRLFISILAVLIMVSWAQAGDKGTSDEAKAMIEKAAAYIKAEGKEKALEEFSNPKGKFNDRDLYIFANDLSGKTLAHGGNVKLVGKDMSKLQDAKGEYFIQKMTEVAKTKGSGWVDYQWTNPVSKKTEPKSTYVLKIDDYYLGCGIYK
jgi:signal transduction histidine kinase